jgi:hypothetical protein
VPLPLLAAFVSTYAQFVCGILFVVGAGWAVEELKAQGLADFRREGVPSAPAP